VGTQCGNRSFLLTKLGDLSGASAEHERALAIAEAAYGRLLKAARRSRASRSIALNPAIDRGALEGGL